MAHFLKVTVYLNSKKAALLTSKLTFTLLCSQQALMCMCQGLNGDLNGQILLSNNCAFHSSAIKILHGNYE